MDAGEMAAAVAVMRQPHLAPDMPHQHKDMMASDCDHAGSRFSPRKAQPICRQIERRDDPAEDMERCPAAAEGVRTARGTAANHPSRAIGYDPLQGNRQRSGSYLTKSAAYLTN